MEPCASAGILAPTGGSRARGPTREEPRLPANPLLACLLRGGRLESLHRGAVAVATADTLVWSGGDVTTPIFPRSALKPFQALPLLEAGLDRALGLTEREIALTSASHSGDEQHVEVAAALLAKGEIPA